MAGQPQIPGFFNFDVMDLQVTREEKPLFDPPFTAFNMLNIVDLGEEFDLTVAFTAAGTGWDSWIVNTAGGLQNIQANFNFYADEIGGNDRYLGASTVALNTLEDPANPGTFKYTHKVTGSHLPPRGIYDVGATVTIDVNGNPLHGVLGFIEGLKMQVHEREG
jgi:hypothetical protein